MMLTWYIDHYLCNSNSPGWFKALYTMNLTPSFSGCCGGSKRNTFNFCSKSNTYCW